MARFINPNGHAASVADYGEAAYFEGFAFAHIAAYAEALRLRQRDRRDRLALRDRRTGGRAGLTGRRASDKGGR